MHKDAHLGQRILLWRRSLRLVGSWAWSRLPWGDNILTTLWSHEGTDESTHRKGSGLAFSPRFTPSHPWLTSMLRRHSSINLTGNHLGRLSLGYETASQPKSWPLTYLAWKVTVLQLTRQGCSLSQDSMHGIWCLIIDCLFPHYAFLFWWIALHHLFLYTYLATSSPIMCPCLYILVSTLCHKVVSLKL